MSRKLEVSEIDDMSKEELKKELKTQAFDEYTRPELVKNIADELGLKKGRDYSYGNILVPGLKKIYLQCCLDADSF